MPDQPRLAASLMLHVADHGDGPGSLLPAQRVAVPEPSAGARTAPELAFPPIDLAPILDSPAAEAAWRQWQLTRQRAEAQARQAERDQLTQTVQEFLRRTGN